MTNDEIEAWYQTHFSHLTPGTPDHFTASRAKADLIARLTPAQVIASEPTETSEA